VAVGERINFDDLRILEEIAAFALLHRRIAQDSLIEMSPLAGCCFSALIEREGARNWRGTGDDLAGDINGSGLAKIMTERIALPINDIGAFGSADRNSVNDSLRSVNSTA
jgi:hypothetical protein